MPAKETYALSEEAGLLFKGLLTTGIVLALPQGAIVQSNTYTDRQTPVAIEKVGSLANREELWKRLRALRVTNITCNVWRDFEAYERFRMR